MLKVSLEQARKNAEDVIGFKIPDSTADYILGYTLRKFNRITENEDKPEGYLEILYQNEIVDHCTRKAITVISDALRKENDYVFCM